ncbi:MAG: ABC transporter permease, partial [Bacteroidales bacterium]
MPLKHLTSKRHPGPARAPRRIRHPFFAFVQKEAIHILRDRWTTLILLGLPVLMLVLFGFAISTELKNTSLVILDPSTDPSTRAITEKLRANDYFSVTGRLEGPEEIEKTFRRGQAGMVVVFSHGFHESLIRGESAQIQLLVDGSDPNAATTLVQYATNIIMDYLGQFYADRGISPGIEPEVKLLYNPGMKGAYQFVPGVMGMVLMLICAMMTSIAITREKELGSMEVLLASPVKPLTIILAKTVPYFILSLINLST